MSARESELTDRGARECGWISDQLESRKWNQITQVGQQFYAKPPSRHSPWRSDAERIILAPATGLSTELSRAVAPSKLPVNRSSRFLVKPGVDISMAMFASPIRVGRPGTAGSMRNPNLYGRVTDNMHGETPSSARMTPSPQSVAMLPEKTGSAIVKRDKDFEEGASAATIQSATGENATVMRILRPGSSGGGNQNQAAASHVGDASLLGSAFAPPRPRSPVRWDFAAPQKRFMTPPAQMVDTSAGAAALTTKDGSNRGAGRSSRRGSTRQGASRPGSAAMRSQLDGRPTTPGAMTTYRSSFGLGTPRTHPWSRSGGLQTIPLSLSLQLSSGAHAPDPARGGGVGGPFAPVTSTGPTNAAGSRLRNASDGAQQQQMNSPQPQSSSSPSSPPLPTNAPTIPTQPQNILRLSTPSLTPMLGVRSFGARSAVHRDFFSDTSIGFGSRDAKFHAEKYFEVKSLTSDYLEGIRTPKMFWRK